MWAFVRMLYANRVPNSPPVLTEMGDLSPQLLGAAIAHTLETPFEIYVSAELDSLEYLHITRAKGELAIEMALFEGSRVGAHEILASSGIELKDPEYIDDGEPYIHSILYNEAVGAAQLVEVATRILKSEDGLKIYGQPDPRYRPPND